MDGLEGNRRGFALVYLGWVLAVLYWVGLRELVSALDDATGLRSAVPRVGSAMDRSYAGGGYKGVVFGVECFFEPDSVVVEPGGWIYVIDQAYWRFSDPRMQRICP